MAAPVATSTEEIVSYDPATGGVVGSVQLSSEKDVAEAVTRARSKRLVNGKPNHSPNVPAM